MTNERSNKGRTAAATTLSGLMVATMAFGAATAANASVEGSPENPITTDQLDFEVSSISLERTHQVAVAGEETAMVVVGYSDDFSQGAVLDPSTYVVRTNNDDDVVDGNVITFAADEDGEVVDREVTVVYERGLGTTWNIRVAPDAESAVGIGVTVEFNDETHHGYAPPMAPGDTFTVSAEGPFFFGEDVNIYLGDELIGETVVDYDGQIRGASVTIPEDTQAGDHTLRLVGVDSELESTVEIETFDLELWVDADEITPGEDFAVRGSGFYANEDVSFEMIGDFPSPIASETTADENGVFDLMFNIPTQTEPGRYVARAVGAESDRSSTIGFIVTDAGLEVIDPEDVDIDPVEEYGFDGFRTGSLGSIADGETLALNITPTIGGEDADVEIDEDEFTVSTNGEDDEVDGLNITFNGEGDRVVTVSHDPSGKTITREVVVTEADEADDEDDEDAEVEEVAPVEPEREGNVITIPEVEGVVYTAGNSGEVLSGDVDLDELDVPGIVVNASPASGYEFAEDAETTWSYDRVTEDDEDDADEIIKVTAESPVADHDNNTVEIPEVEGVVYTVGDESVEGTIDIPESGLIIRAELLEGYEFSEDSDQRWGFTYTDHSEGDPDDEDSDEDEDNGDNGTGDEDGDNGDSGSGDEEVEEVRSGEIALLHETAQFYPGDFIDLQVSGLFEGDTVNVSLNPELGTLVANAGGVAEGTVMVPEDTEPGVHDLNFTSDDFDLDETLQIRVLSADEEIGGDFEPGDRPEGSVEFTELDEGPSASVIDTGGTRGGPSGGDAVGPDGTVVDDRGDESAMINTGFIAENPGASAGLAALALGGLSALGFGAYRLMARRTA